MCHEVPFVEAIESKRSSLVLDDDADPTLAFTCFNEQRSTLPYRNSCVPCDDLHVGCSARPIVHWHDVCELYCGPLSILKGRKAPGSFWFDASDLIFAAILFVVSGTLLCAIFTLFVYIIYSCCHCQQKTIESFPV